MEERWLRILSREKTVRRLKLASRLSLLVFVLSAGEIAAASFLLSVKRGILVCLFGAGSFLAVTLVRALFDLPRPYETFDLLPAEEKQKRKKGKSFPSRHTFSAFFLAGIAFTVSLPCALILLILACFLGAARVLLAYHYPRDVLVGAFLGLIAAVLAAVFLGRFGG